MRFAHPEHAGRGVRLAYCMNLHAGEMLDELLAGVREISVPLRARLAPESGFGVGLYLPGALARELAAESGAARRARLSAALDDARLEPFTFNAFPFGGFHSAGLKARVFEPTWTDPARLAYTLDVARLAAELNRGREERVTISTHPGRFGPWRAGEFELCAAQIGRALVEFAALRAAGGPLLVLALEAEPRAVAGTTAEVAALVARLRETLSTSIDAELLDAHLGVCLDACHSAVEFEDPREAARLALGAHLGKLQFSSAIALARPAEHAAARAALLALDEPRYLHQTSGRRGDELLRVDDLPELGRAAQASAAHGRNAWLACDEWRTHFHVPVDLVQLADDGLTTTREHASQLLDALLAVPEQWGARELQVEIETYTWDILPGPARGAGALESGLAREYRFLFARLAAAGWTPAP